MKKFLPGIKTAFLIGLAIVMAYAFIWQRITLQNISAEIRGMEEDVRQLEKNRDYLKADILYRSSLEQIKNRATAELGMISSSDSTLVVYSDSLVKHINSQTVRPSESGQDFALENTEVNTVNIIPDGKANER